MEQSKKAAASPLLAKQTYEDAEYGQFQTPEPAYVTNRKCKTCGVALTPSRYFNCSTCDVRYVYNDPLDTCAINLGSHRFD